MFGLGKKKVDLPGIRLMHYEGLPGFQQDAPCFMEPTGEALIFRRVEGSSVTLPMEKVTGIDLMPEKDFAARYRGTGLNTSRTNAVKWYAVISYTPGKYVALWYLGGKEGDALRDLQHRVTSSSQDITL